MAAVDIEHLAGDQLGCVMRQNGGGDLVRLPVGLTKGPAVLGALLTSPCSFTAMGRALDAIATVLFLSGVANAAPNKQARTDASYRIADQQSRFQAGY